MSAPEDKPTTVAAVVAKRKADRDAEEKRRADVQERADKRRSPGWGTT